MYHILHLSSAFDVFNTPQMKYRSITDLTTPLVPEPCWIFSFDEPWPQEVTGPQSRLRNPQSRLGSRLWERISRLWPGWSSRALAAVDKFDPPSGNPAMGVLMRLRSATTPGLGNSCALSSFWIKGGAGPSVAGKPMMGLYFRAGASVIIWETEPQS